MSNSLIEKLEAVGDRESFLAFVKALIADREDEIAKEKEQPNRRWYSGARGWENGTIEDYLEAAVAWAEDSKGLPQELPEKPSWRAFAEFHYCGKIYE